MQQLVKQRDKAIEQLRDLGAKMLIGTVSETFRTCGQPTCRCHSTGPKHGPHLYVSYRGEHGRTTGYYVPKAMHQQVREGLDAWKQFQQLAKELAHLNKQILDAQRPPKKKRSKRK